MKSFSRLLSKRDATRSAGTKGSAALIALTTILPLVVAAGTMLAVVVRNRTALEVNLAKRTVSDAASAGAQDALAKLQGTPDYVGTYDADIGGTIAHVTVTDWSNDLVDNDGLNGVDDPAETGFVAVSSDAWINVVTDGNGNRIDVPSRAFHGLAEVLLKRLDLSVAVKQAAYVDDENADLTLGGEPFTISGNDTNLDGTAGPQPAIPGIGVAGATYALLTQLSGATAASVVGSGGTPSVETVTAYDFPSIMLQLARAATINFHGPDDEWTGALGDLASMTPVVTHARGNLLLRGATTGCGMLVVDGDLEIADSFDYAGVVFVKGSVKFTGSGATTVHGALMTAGSIDDSGLAAGGTVTLDYSSEALANVATRLANSYVLVAWTQK